MYNMGSVIYSAGQVAGWHSEEDEMESQVGGRIIISSLTGLLNAK